jgi:Carboxypeptidase regulatory-like domain
MYESWIKWVILAGLWTGLSALAQQTCTGRIHVEGMITDQTGAAIPGATVQAAGISVTTDATGHYVLACVGANAVITSQANGFANGGGRVLSQAAGKVHFNIQLAVAAVQTGARWRWL